jgi:hypothetical protein
MGRTRFTSFQERPSRCSTNLVSCPLSSGTQIENWFMESYEYLAFLNNSSFFGGAAVSVPCSFGGSFPSIIKAKPLGVTYESTIASAIFIARPAARTANGLSFSSAEMFFIIAALSWPFRFWRSFGKSIFSDNFFESCSITPVFIADTVKYGPAATYPASNTRITPAIQTTFFTVISPS